MNEVDGMEPPVSDTPTLREALSLSAMVLLDAAERPDADGNVTVSARLLAAALATPPAPAGDERRDELIRRVTFLLDGDVPAVTIAIVVRYIDAAWPSTGDEGLREALAVECPDCGEGIRHRWPCPHIERCDEPGCDREADCGWPTKAGTPTFSGDPDLDGYRRTCGDHFRAALDGRPR